MGRTMSRINYAVATPQRDSSLDFFVHTNNVLVSLLSSLRQYRPTMSSVDDPLRNPVRRHGRRGISGPSASVVLPSRRNTNDSERIEGLRGAGTS